MSVHWGARSVRRPDGARTGDPGSRSSSGGWTLRKAFRRSGVMRSEYSVFDKDGPAVDFAGYELRNTHYVPMPERLITAPVGSGSGAVDSRFSRALPADRDLGSW